MHFFSPQTTAALLVFTFWTNIPVSELLTPRKQLDTPAAPVSNNNPYAQQPIPAGWRKIDAHGKFTFYLPPNMRDTRIGGMEKLRAFLWQFYADVRQHQVASDRAIGQTTREREPGRRRRDRLEPEALQIFRAADVPGIRQREAAALVELPKTAAPFRDRLHRSSLTASRKFSYLCLCQLDKSSEPTRY